MRIPALVLLAGAALAAAAPIQAQIVTDVGLMMDGGVLTVIYGQNCGPFSCIPVQAGPTGVGQPYNVYVHGAPQQVFALAADVDAGQPCVPVPGIGNLLMLSQPVTLAFGFTGNAGAVGACLQGRGTYVLQFPTGTPPGVGYRLQALAISASQNVPAFTITIRSVTA